MKKILIFFAAFFIFTSATAGQIKDIVFFGDSLSDDGNLYEILKIIPKSPPYYKGRFSNGMTWAEHVGNYYYDKYYVEYSNYAYGGATAIVHQLRTDPFIAPTVLEAEIDGYLKNSILKDKSKALYTIWIGANDYLYEKTDQIDVLTDKVVNKIIESTKTLIAKGGTNFFILNLPDLSKTPYSRNNNLSERLANITLIHNTKLFNAVNQLQNENPNVKIIFFDLYTLFGDILVNPDKYNQQYGTNVTDTKNACWLGAMVGTRKVDLMNDLKLALDQPKINFELAADLIMSSPALSNAYVSNNQFEKLEPCNNADEYLFWDELHPTAIIHKILGQIVIKTLDQQKII